MVKKSIIAIVAIAFLLVLSLSPASAEISVLPGYEASVFAIGIDHPLSLIFNKEGTLFVAAGGTDEIVKVDHRGIVSPFASSYVNPLDFSPIYPHSKMTFGLDGNLYIGVVGWYDNQYNHYGDVLDKLYRISPDGTISVAASGTGCCADPFDDISGIATSSNGDIYFADTWISRAVFSYSPVTGVVNTFISTSYGWPDSIWDIMFDKEGNLLVAVPSLSRILKVAPDRTITTFLSSIPVYAMEYNSGGDLYVSNYNSIYKVAPDGTYSLFASGFDRAFDLSFDKNDNLYVVENGANDIIKISIRNQPPTANAGGPYSVGEGSSITLSGSGTDPDNDPLTFSWDLNNDGTFETAGQNPTFSAAGRDGPSNQTVVLRVCDNRDACATSSTTVSINNVAPTVNAGQDASQFSGQTFNLSAGFSDPGANDALWSFTIAWGDSSSNSIGSTSTQGSGIIIGSHQYFVPGFYTIQLCVTDKDGGQGCDSLMLEVQRLPVQIDIKPGSFPNSINLGSGGTVPVAIFSTQTFDATTVDPTTITLASAPVKLKGQGTSMASFQDVNGDGLLDMVVHVSTEALQLSETDTEAILESQTFGGTHIRGTDSLRIVP